MKCANIEANMSEKHRTSVLQKFLPFFFYSFLALIFLSIEEIKRIKWIEFTIFPGEHDACTLDRAHIQIVSIHK